MAFWQKKPRTFNVDLEIVDLSSVSFLTGQFFCKVRLKSNSSKFCQTTKQQEVYNHSVQWNAKMGFSCKLTTDSKDVLKPCMCRISVRYWKGMSVKKLGYQDLNLSAFAGVGQLDRVTKKYLLKAYHKWSRPDNSILKVKIRMVQVRGDCRYTIPTLLSPLDATDNVVDDTLPPSKVSSSNELDSHEQQGDPTRLDTIPNGRTPFKPTHRRNASAMSNKSELYADLCLGVFDGQLAQTRTDPNVFVSEILKVEPVEEESRVTENSRESSTHER